MIQRLFTSTIYVQTNTPAWDGSPAWADRGSNKGYIRVLSGRERPSGDKPTQFVTHRATMEKTIIPVYGERLRIGSSYYNVVTPNPLDLCPKGVQIVDCEVVT